jgi:nucleoside-diphosphate-sugar epimerase
MHCAQDTRAAGRTYLVSDGEDLSTPELIRRIGRAMGVSVRLWPMPLPLLRWMAQIVGKKAMIDRLTGNLRIDAAKLRQELRWSPPWPVNRGIEETVVWFLKRQMDEASVAQ